MLRWLPIFEVHQPAPPPLDVQVQEYMVPAEPRPYPGMVPLESHWAATVTACSQGTVPFTMVTECPEDVVPHE
jgi:hypothetical protein